MQQTVPAVPQSAQDWVGGKKVESGATFRTRKLNTPLDKLTRNVAGKRSMTRTKRKRGRYIKAVPLRGRVEDLAFDATLRAAALHQQARRREALMSNGSDAALPAFFVRPVDYHRKVRVRRAANLILFVVDASWSMAVAERMAATKGAIMSLLTDAYQRRDRVGLIVFQKNSATLVLPPTSSVELAQKALREIPVGGKTPLSAGLALALHVVQRERRLHPEVMPLLIILTDGAGNVSIGNLPPQVEAHRIANQIRDACIRAVVVNMEHAAFDQGLARKLAEQMDARCLSLRELHADVLYEAVKKELR
ncbi:MAG: VWA domain-containing protein [Thermoflexales bacterium]|nr:VWA domain-containing protein [Thermoflexales bacterium]MCS7325455.1 VWA domain-containing protein [Thermoflexales bacterium]MDW8054559.1 VWA domain-containing protein [Anaerolineae bacterium]MDW8292694.1 VWA domain-containing protein [Anaerolineae bacterium]